MVSNKYKNWKLLPIFISTWVAILQVIVYTQNWDSNLSFLQLNSPALHSKPTLFSSTPDKQSGNPSLTRYLCKHLSEGQANSKEWQKSKGNFSSLESAQSGWLSRTHSLGMHLLVSSWHSNSVSLSHVIFGIKIFSVILSLHWKMVQNYKLICFLKKIKTLQHQGFKNVKY